MAGVLANGGSAYALAHGFAVFGYHVTGSTGTLFLYGLVVGALALLGLSLLPPHLSPRQRRAARTRSVTRRDGRCQEGSRRPDRPTRGRPR